MLLGAHRKNNGQIIEFICLLLYNQNNKVYFVEVNI